jgi:transposase-like protein
MGFLRHKQPLKMSKLALLLSIRPDIECPHCGSLDLQKNGHSENGTQRWRCNGCRKSFQLTYRYNARKPGVKEQIDELTLNSSGVRDIGRILKISTNTVIARLKKNAKREPIYS